MGDPSPGALGRDHPCTFPVHHPGSVPGGLQTFLKRTRTASRRPREAPEIVQDGPVALWKCVAVARGWKPCCARAFGMSSRENLVRKAFQFAWRVLHSSGRALVTSLYRLLSSTRSIRSGCEIRTNEELELVRSFHGEGVSFGTAWAHVLQCQEAKGKVKDKVEATDGFQR